MTVDRRSTLRSSTTILGIDYLALADPTQTVVDVHFVSPPTVTQQARITKEVVSIVGAKQNIAPIPVMSVEFVTVNTEVVLRVHTVMPGTFARYRLQLADPTGPQLFDPYFASVEFSFKAGCYSDVDCDHGTHECVPELDVDFAVDYQARDFWSLRTALLDFASQRYPNWADRLEADAGVMLVEVMAALGDELSYYQDRIAREAHLETATQRRSVRRHARLVDYQMHDGLGATTWIDVTAKQTGGIEAGTALWAWRDGHKIEYSVGRNLNEILSKKKYTVDPALNDLRPYQWDSRDTCLAVGSTQLWLEGGDSVLNKLKPFNDLPDGRVPGRWVVLRTEPTNPRFPARRHLVRVIDAQRVHDPLANVDTTHIVWENAQSLPHEFDLLSLHVSANIIPAVAGSLQHRNFVIGPEADSDPSTASLLAAESPQHDDATLDPPQAIERVGPNGSNGYLFSLYRTDVDDLVRRDASHAADAVGQTVLDARAAVPELHLSERIPQAGGGFISGDEWEFRSTLLSSTGLDKHFTLDDGYWRRIVGYQRNGDEIVHSDYASDAGVTIRFGDGVFGTTPARGTRFHADYLVGNGRRANVGADTIRWFDPAIAGKVSAVGNPFAVDSGVDAETPHDVRQLAPEEFRSVTYRAVRPEDYAEAAERLPWVQRSGCTVRWTGSWPTVFVTPDPRNSVEITQDEYGELEIQLDRFRQAGRQTHALRAHYADLDLQIRICVARHAYRSEVTTNVRTALYGSPISFFAADNFTFGTPLDRSRLEATIQHVPGVRAVEDITFRRRGQFDWIDLPAAYQPGRNEVLRVENDPLHPDRGSVQLTAEGGA
jgi:hypothetical protein